MSSKRLASNNNQLPEGYKKTEVGVIPEDWEPYKIDDVVSFSGGSQPPRSTFIFKSRAGYLRLIQIRDYKTDEYETYIPEKLAKKKCAKKDIMIGRYGPPIFQILRGIEGAYNVALIKAIPSSKVDQEFFYYFIQDEKIFKLMEMLSQRSSGQTGVDLPELKKYSLGLPPLPEQKAIAQTLSDVDALIAALDKLIAKKRNIKTATMQQLLTGKTRLPGFGERKDYKKSEVGVIPEDWAFIPLKLVCKVNQGLQIAIEKRLKNQNGKAKRYITIQSLNSDANLEYIDNYASSVVCNEEDILMTRTGNTGIVITGVSGVFHNNFFKVKFDKSKIDKNYFVFCLKSNFIQKEIMEKAGTSTIPDLNHNDFYSIRVILPPLHEQKAIAQVLSDMDKEITALEKRRAKTQAIKQGMMQELLTGRTRLI